MLMRSEEARGGPDHIITARAFYRAPLLVERSRMVATRGILGNVVRHE